MQFLLSLLFVGSFSSSPYSRFDGTSLMRKSGNTRKKSDPRNGQMMNADDADDSSNSSITTGSNRMLRLAVFDLDYTVWQPEMYQLYGQPKLVKADADGRMLSTVEKHETRTTEEGKIIVDKSGTPMRVFTGASYALADIHRLREEGHELRAAIASRTDEPQYAFFCMQHLVVPVRDSKKGNEGQQQLVTLLDCFGSTRKNNPLIQISFHDKTHHFERLHYATGIPYEEMVFFDNENWNIQSVSKLGVKCIYTPDGMQKKHWDQAKKAFGMEEA